MRRLLILFALVWSGCGKDSTAANDSGALSDAAMVDESTDADVYLDPLTHLVPTDELTLSPGNEAGQDEDPSIFRAADGALYVTWYSNRNGIQEDGVLDREIFLMRSYDGATWTEPVQITQHARFSFYPSLAQDSSGAFHMAWWRMIPIPEGCIPEMDCTGTTNQIMYKTSSTGTDWTIDAETSVTQGPGDWLPSLIFDQVAQRLMVYFASPVRDANGEVDLSETTLRIYVCMNNAGEWSAPQRLVGINPDTSHNTYPFVAQRDDGQFIMTWTRYDASASSDVLQVIQEPSTQTLYSTSEDGVVWTEPIVLSSDTALDVFPSLYANHARSAWYALWQTAEVGATSSDSVETLLNEGSLSLTPRPEMPGYSARALATATPDIYWGVWVSGPSGQQKIRHRFFKNS